MKAARTRVSRRELRALLLEAAEHPVVDARPNFLTGLDARLGAQVPPGRLIALPRRTRRARVPVLATGVAAAAAAAVLLGALTGVYGRGVEDRALALAVAVDTTVQLPDGSTVAGVRGAALPDGAVVRTGPNGRCSAGDVDFGPGIEALVDSGRLRLRPAASAAAAPTPATGGTAAITASDPVPPAVPITTAPTTTTPTTRPVPARSPVTAPGDLVRAGSEAPRSGH